MAVLSKIRLSAWLGLVLTVFLTVVAFATKIPSIAAAPATIASPSPLSLTQGVQKTVLPNGLTVLTKEIHTAPVVSVQIWYRVGSRNETVEQNGISHQLEHLMFKGTVNRPIQFGRFFTALGSQSNAFTGYDETAYFGTVQSNKLEALLTLEADRMTNALVNREQLDSERRVVISELQGYENSPDYRLNRAVMQAAFSYHPYGLMPAGTKTAVEQFTTEQVRRYYQTYYRPDNAILVITGDFSTQPVLQKVQDLFGRVPSTNQQLLRSASTRSAQTAASPIVLKEAGSAALLEAVYPLPKLTHPDVPAIDLMDYILTGGRSSRLYQALVESGLASSVSAYPEELLELGWYTIMAVAAPGKSLEQIDQVLQQTIAEIRKTPVGEAELRRAKTLLKTAMVLNNQDITSQASQLAYDQTVAGDYRYSDRYLAAIDRVTVADIQRVAQTYLDADQRTLGLFEPTTEGADVSLADSSRTIESFSLGQPVDPAEVARYLPPIPPQSQSTQPLPTQLTLNNGLQVLLLPDPSTPMVNLTGWISAGSGFDPEPKAGLASLTADNLTNGTQTQDALTLAKTLEDVGADLSFAAYPEGVSFSGYVLNENLPTLVQTLADVLQRATFPADQLELSRQRALISLKAELDDPNSLSWHVFQQAIYPKEHPFHRFATEASLNRITQTDLASFYQTHYRPDTTSIALVGNFNPDQVRSLLNQSFSNWQAEEQPPTLEVAPVALPAATIRLNRAIPGKTEAVTYLGYQGISRTDPRFYAALVLNQILGGDTLSSRLGLEIRDRQGLTYGIYSFFDTGIHPGAFAIEMQTSPQDADRAIESTVALLNQLRQQGITTAELETAKRSITSSYPVDLANPSSLASAILGNQVYGLSQEELRQFPQKIAAVTLEQVQQTIADLIHPEQLIIVTTGPNT